MALAQKRARVKAQSARLSLPQVLDAAVEVGLDQLTMTAVATRLGVSKSALYGYVESREELARLADAHASGFLPFPEDSNQPWPEYVLEHARALFDLLTRAPGLIDEYMAGGLGAVTQADSMEAFVVALTKRGFAGEDAILLQQAVGFVVLGAAINHAHASALKAKGMRRSTQARQMVQARPLEELPFLRLHLKTFAREADASSWEYSLMLLLHGVASMKLVLAKHSAYRPFVEAARLPGCQ